MKVLIADKYESEGVEQLTALGCEVTTNADLAGPALGDALRGGGHSVLVVRSNHVTKEIIDAAASLKLVVRAGAGYDTIDVVAAAARGVRVANCPGTNSVAVAELVMGLMLALDRRIADNVVDLRRGAWNKNEYSKARGLKGRTLGIVGLGRIGCELAKRAKAFDMALLYTDVVRNERAEAEFGIRKVELEVLLRQSDFVSLHVPGGGETKHLIDADKLALMKPTAFLVNCSRGGVVDEKAMAGAIERGALAGAGLDVYEIEPGAKDTAFTDPVVKVPRVYGTHHIGASTDQAQLAVAAEVTRVVEHYRKTGEVLNCVN